MTCPPMCTHLIACAEEERSLVWFFAVRDGLDLTTALRRLEDDPTRVELTGQPAGRHPRRPGDLRLR
jgi:hypothetical protein